MRVLDSKRAPVRNAHVIKYIDGYGQYDSKSDGAGWAQAAPELGGLRRGKVKVRVIAGDHGEGEVELDMTDGKDGRGEIVLPKQVARLSIHSGPVRHRIALTRRDVLLQRHRGRRAARWIDPRTS